MFYLLGFLIFIILTMLYFKLVSVIDNLNYIRDNISHYFSLLEKETSQNTEIFHKIEDHLSTHTFRFDDSIAILNNLEESLDNVNKQLKEVKNNLDEINTTLDEINTTIETKD